MGKCLDLKAEDLQSPNDYDRVIGIARDYGTLGDRDECYEYIRSFVVSRAIENDHERWIFDLYGDSTHDLRCPEPNTEILKEKLMRSFGFYIRNRSQDGLIRRVYPLVCRNWKGMLICADDGEKSLEYTVPSDLTEKIIMLDE